jgi:hypothetical protein
MILQALCLKAIWNVRRLASKSPLKQKLSIFLNKKYQKHFPDRNPKN